MKKFFITMMCIIMVVCFMPTVALAGSMDGCSGGECTHAAAIGTTHYDTLQEAFADSTSGDTIVMLKDFENSDLSNSVDFTLKNGVTLDGKGHAIRGNSSVSMCAETSGVSTIQNVTFRYIHNGSMASQNDCDWYGWTEGKQGTKSAVYARSIQGTVNINNCIFDNADWDAIQMTPNAGATINITGNTFSHSSTVDYSQLRYIHIQPSSTISVNVTITDNKFFNTKNTSAEAITNIGMWYVNNNGNIDLTGNWFETTADDFNCEFSNQKIHQLYPMRSQADVNVDDCKCEYVAYIGSKYYKTLDEAFDAVKTATSSKSVYLIKNVTVDSTLKFENTNGQWIYLYLNGYELTGNNCTPIEFATKGCNTFAYNGTISATGSNPAITYSGDAKLFVGSSATNTVNTKGAIQSIGTGAVSVYGGTHIGEITANGNITLTLGTYSFEPVESQYNKYQYKVVQDGGNWSIIPLTTDELEATGYKVAGDSAATVRYPSISEAIAKGATSVYLLNDITENVNLENTGLYIYTNGHTLTGDITVDAEGKNVYFNNKNGGSIKGNITIQKGNVYVYAAVEGNIVNNGKLSVCQSSSYGAGDMKGTITNNATLVMGYSKAIINNLDNKSAGAVSISAGTVNGTITNEPNGTVTLSGGKYKTNPEQYLTFSFKSTYDDSDKLFTISLLSDAEAIEQGAKVRYYSSSTSVYRRYYKSIADALNDGKSALYLLQDVTEDITYSGTSALGLYCGEHSLRGSINAPGTVCVYNGTADISDLHCVTFKAGYSSNTATITLNNGSAGDISVSKNCSLTINGGTYSGKIAVTSGGTGSLTITGGTFSSDVSQYIPKNYVEYAMRNGTYIVKASSADKPAFTTGNYWSDLNGKVYTEMYSAPYIPPTPTDNVTNSGSSSTDNASTNADLSGSTSTSNGTTTAEVDKTTADKIVDKAVENKSTEVVIDATANTTTAADSTTIAQVTIPTETLGAIAEKTEADVTIKTDVAEVKMDNAAAAAVSEQAEGDTVKIIAEKVKEDATEVHFELKVVCSDGKVISDFKGGNIAVTVALPKAMAEKKVVCVYIDDNGHMSKVEGQKNADGTYTFFTGHFSTYAIMAEEEADAAIAAQTEAIKNIKIKLTSKQVKTKSGKKGIKITWTAAAGDKVLDGVEVFRSKEKNKGYGTKAFFTSTKGGNKGSYINTKSLKKGTRYYYKVRGYVLVNGEKVYTDYSTKAWRTVK